MMFHHQFFFQVLRSRPVRAGSSLSLSVSRVLRDRSSLPLRPSQRKILHFRTNLTSLLRILVRLVCMLPDLSSIFLLLETSLKLWSSENSLFSIRVNHVENSRMKKRKLSLMVSRTKTTSSTTVMAILLTLLRPGSSSSSLV